ncbi:MAG: hypothetical protein IJ187_09880 [Neisseriaceae bacterium]|nr:hypothetical protein [Neisseriaceae bacterium]MBQ9723727.1 hypothetical protein [Neisseriaceae bacterium]
MRRVGLRPTEILKLFRQPESVAIHKEQTLWQEKIAILMMTMTIMTIAHAV